MSNYLQQFLADFDYPEAAVSELTSAYEKLVRHDEAKLNAIVKIYEDSISCDFGLLLKKCEELALEAELHEYQVKLIVLIMMSKALLQRYIAAGYTYQFWYDTMLDLKYKAMECKDVKNIWGTFVGSWFVSFFDMTRFAFGRFQCALIDFGSSYSEGDKVLREDSRVINVHIPRSFKPLTREVCLESYSAAADFFKDELCGAPVAFVCSSWLLYSKNYDILPEHSNIRKFMEDYTILRDETDPKGVYKDMWRLFDMDYTGDINDYPEDTSLRRAYKKHLLLGGSTGEGFGVFFYPPKK